MGVWGELASHNRLSAPVLKAGHPVSCSHVMSCVFVYVFFMDVFGICGYIGGGFYLFISLSIYLSIYLYNYYTYGLYAMNYNFMLSFQRHEYKNTIMDVYYT